LDLEVNQDSIGEQLQTGEIIINTNKLKTQVLIGDGETLVLGGIFKVEREQSIVKVPLLGDIPLLGHLFQRKLNTEDKLELLVFITPKIIRDALSVQ
jgi:type IV pilus assembly protein PilQ